MKDKEISGMYEKLRGAVARPVPAWDAPAELVLDERGMILDCNAVGAGLFRHAREDLIRQHVSLLFPQLADMELMQGGKPTERFRFLCSIGCGFQVLGGDGERFVSELFLNDLGNAGQDALRLIVRRV